MIQKRVAFGLVVLGLAAGSAAVVMPVVNSESASAISPTAGNGLDVAYKSANPGDTVTVESGSYPCQILTYDAAKVGATERVVVEAAGATFECLEFRGTQHVEVRNVTVNRRTFVGPSNGSVINANTKYATDIEVSGGTLKEVLIRNAVWVTVRGGSIGGYNVSTDGLGVAKVGAYASDDGLPTRKSTGILFDGVFFHDIIRTVTGSTHAECFFVDGGTDGLTIRDSTFTNCGVFDIFGGPSAAGGIANVTIERNLLDIPRDTVGGAAPSAINFKGGNTNLVIRGNSILGNIRFDTASYPGLVREKNAIGGTGGSSLDVMASDPGFVSASRAACDLSACFRNDLHVTPDSVAGVAGAGVPVAGTPPPPPPPPTETTPPPPPPPPAGPTTRELLDSAWASWGESSLIAKWRRFNPGEATKLDAYRASCDQPPELATAVGQALVFETRAWCGV